MTVSSFIIVGCVTDFPQPSSICSPENAHSRQGQIEVLTLALNPALIQSD